jgi:DNA mismatch endonuclease (patch repair protein)
VSTLPGKPDVVFKSCRVLVFCDGDFWHGRNWRSLKKSLGAGTNSDYWLAKIESNRKRDRLTNIRLRKAGWRVIRLWETDINRDPVSAATLIKDVLRRSRRNMTAGGESRQRSTGRLH